MKTNNNAAISGDGSIPNDGKMTTTEVEIGQVANEIGVLLKMNESPVENVLPQIKFLVFDKEGDFFDGIYQGKKKMKFDAESEEKEYASFVGKDGNLYLTSSWKLMQIPDTKIGFPMRIVYRGKIQKDGKQINLFDVYALKIQ